MKILPYTCPICHAEMKVERYIDTDPYCLCEEYIECPNSCYVFQYDHGDTQISIQGCVVVGYNYGSSQEYIENEYATLGNRVRDARRRFYE